MAVINKISFRPLTKSDMPLMHTWFNQPHVQQYYSLREWSLGEVEAKLLPYIEGAGNVFGFIISMDATPVGYVQCYRVADHPWPNQDIAEDIVNQAAGIDLFIGDEKHVGKRLGTTVVTEILDQLIWPHFDYCVADPDVRNIAMIKCCEYAGFKSHKFINTTDKLGKFVQLHMMIARNPKEAKQRSGH